MFKPPTLEVFYVWPMTNDQISNELPVFPATAPGLFKDTAVVTAMFQPVLADLGDMVTVEAGSMDRPTPCDGFTVGELRRHVLGWLQFFAEALNDPAGQSERIDAETWELADGQDAAAIVTEAAAAIDTAIAAGVADELVVMSQARMTGDCVLAMALGEYLVHGWDLATATGRAWAADDGVHDAAAEAALAFLETTVAPEYRGPDSGFFGYEVPAPDGATPFQQLLCFTGRDPQWDPTAG